MVFVCRGYKLLTRKPFSQRFLIPIILFYILPTKGASGAVLNISGLTLVNAQLVTAADTKHFEEIKDAIGSVQNFLPTNKLKIYDIGLTKLEVMQVCIFL